MKSKYFIAYLLSGPARAYHERLTRHLVSRFRIFPLHERVSPHITVKAPFFADDDGIAEVERILRAFARNEPRAPLLFRGFGRFGFRTVYLDVDKSPQAVSLVRRAIRTVNENAVWISKAPLEGNKLHASVARFMDRKQSRRVLRFLASEKPTFSAEFDNIAILKKEGSVWKVTTVIPLIQEPSWTEELHSVFSMEIPSPGRSAE